MNKTFFLITAFGKDRPGMVAGISAVLFKVGANIEDATMTRLGGEFSMMLVVSAPSKVTIASLSKHLAPLQKVLGLDISVKPVPATAVHPVTSESPQYLISVYGMDHPGIVSEITQAIARRKISITDLQTKVTSGAKPLYVMMIEIAVPESVDMNAFREDLDDLRAKLRVEVTLQDIEAVAL